MTDWRRPCSILNFQQQMFGPGAGNRWAGRPVNVIAGSLFGRRSATSRLTDLPYLVVVIRLRCSSIVGARSTWGSGSGEAAAAEGGGAALAKKAPVNSAMRMQQRTPPEAALRGAALD